LAAGVAAAWRVRRVFQNLISSSTQTLGSIVKAKLTGILQMLDALILATQK
jgi:hypothetical protein